jgi:hypothetical protein
VWFQEDERMAMVCDGAILMPDSLECAELRRANFGRMTARLSSRGGWLAHFARIAQGTARTAQQSGGHADRLAP